MISSTEIALPVVLNGQILTCNDVEKTHLLEYESGITVRLPDLGQDGLDAVKRERAALLPELCALTLHDITTFLSEVGKRWLTSGYPIRAEGERNAAAITGYAPRMLNLDYNFMGYVMHNRPYVYDYIEWELGNERIMDEWCRQKASWVRAFPYGIVLHSMVGNMALANAFTLLWAAMTKNISLGKLPARDPATPLALAQAFVDVDPKHPMARAMSVMYWKHDSALVSAACDIADVVFAWGGNNSIKQLKEKVPANVPFVEFGPKWSLAVVDLDQCDNEMAAWRMAADVTFYDQEANTTQSTMVWAIPRAGRSSSLAEGVRMAFRSIAFERIHLPTRAMQSARAPRSDNSNRSMVSRRCRYCPVCCSSVKA